MDELNLTFFIINIIVVLSAGVMLTLMPFFTRKSLLFGVRIPEEKKTVSEVIAMKRLYSLWVGAFSVLISMLVVAQYVFKPEWSVLTALYAPMLILVAQFAVYIPFWRKALRLKQDKQWYVVEKGSADTKITRSRQTFSQLPWGWYIGSALLTVVAAGIGLYLYPKLPDVLVTHWDASMQPDGWSDKSIMTVLSLPLITLATILIMVGSNMVVWRMKLQVNQDNPSLSYAQHRIYRRLLSHVLGIITLLIAIMMLFLYGMTLELYLPSITQIWAILLVITVIMIALPTALSLKVGQAGYKLKSVNISEEDRHVVQTLPGKSYPKASFQDDRFWVLGMLYFNKEDPTLFVEDRFGTNGGFNYARPAAWIFVALIFGLTVGTYVMATIVFLQQL